MDSSSKLAPFCPILKYIDVVYITLIAQIMNSTVSDFACFITDVITNDEIDRGWRMGRYVNVLGEF